MPSSEPRENKHPHESSRSAHLPEEIADAIEAGPSGEALAEAAPAKESVAQALSAIETPSQAARVADELVAVARDVREQDIREQGGAEPEPSQAIREASKTPGVEKAPATLIEAAKQVAGSSGETREALEQVLHEAMSPAKQPQASPEAVEPSEMLREALIQRMKPLQAVDARLFLAVNHLPHPPWLNGIMTLITVLMNGGFGWIVGLLIGIVLDRKRGLRVFHQVIPPLWFATMTVEYPIKYYFRRKRPFIDIVHAIAVGKKPGTYSFPSGHSAAAFAGAWLLCRHYPRLKGLWYTIAGLVGFSRIYLGAHYPGDVLSGAVTGTVLAEATRWFINRADQTVDRRPIIRWIRPR